MRACVLTATLAAALVAAAGAAADPPLSAVSPESVSVERGGHAAVTLANASGDGIPVKASATVATGAVSVSPPQVTVPPRGALAVDLKIGDAHSKAGSGALVFRVAGEAPVAVPLELTAPPGDTAAWWLVFASLAAAAVAVAVGWTVAKQPPLGRRLGGKTKWDVEKSWASNVGVAQAIVGAVVSAGLLDATTRLLRQDAYTSMTITFTVLFAAAPFVQHTLGVRIGSFMLGAILTVWGVVGELALFGLLVDELNLDGKLPDAAKWPLWGAGLVVFVLVLAHTVAKVGALPGGTGRPGRRVETLLPTFEDVADESVALL